MNHVSIPKDPDRTVQLRPLVDFRGRPSERQLIDYLTGELVDNVLGVHDESEDER